MNDTLIFFNLHHDEVVRNTILLYHRYKLYPFCNLIRGYPGLQFSGGRMLKLEFQRLKGFTQSYNCKGL